MTDHLIDTQDPFEEYTFITKKTKKLSPYQEQHLSLYESAGVRFPKIGTIYSLKYLGRTKKDHLFEGGFKDFVMVEARPVENKYLENTEIGQDVDVLVLDVVETPFTIRGSISAIYESRVQRELVQLSEDDFIVGLIKESSPAGYKVAFSYGGVTLTGFMPNTLAGMNKLSNPESIVGKTLELGVESFSREEGTYIVSRRKYLQTLVPQMMKKLELGVAYRGIVTGTTEFGIFVEWWDCLTGMIHKTNMNPDYKMSQIHPGMAIEFYIKEVIKDKIILTQILKASLWDTIKNGQIFEGSVKDIKQFGTLVNLDDETVGLIHTSEMERLGKKFTPGQDLKVKFLSVDRMSRKIFLTVG